MIYLFDNKESLIKIIPRSELREAVQTIELNKSLSFYVEFKNVNFDLINKCEYIGHFYDNKFYMYRIIKNDVANTNTIKGTHIVFDELKSNGYIRDKRPKGISAALALGIILNGTRWNVGTVQSENTANSSWYDLSRLDALSDFISKWNVELDYRIIFDGQKITGRYIDIYNRLGSYTGKRLVYGSNALDITAESSKANIYTALIGRGKGEEKTDESGEATGGYGRRIQFTEVEWTKEKGNPVNKPRGQEYVEIPERTKQFGFSDGKPRVKVIVFDECTDSEELLRLTYAELENISRPQVTFKTVVYKSMNFYIGDSVNIIRRDLNLFYEARVFKIERNLLNNDLTTIELGDYIPTNAERNTKEIKGRIDAFNGAIENIKSDVGGKVNGLLEDLKSGLELQYFNDKAYNYELSSGNKWHLPPGYYSFDKAIDNNPTKVIYFGAGKIMIANQKNSDGSWRWSTFGTGDGFIADLIIGGHIKGNLIEANSIGSSQIMADSIDGSKIRANSITGSKIAAGSISADNIRAGTITASEIRASTITRNQIDDHTITGREVAYDTLDSDHIKSITVDILRPGYNNRIIFEGSNPGDNDCKSIDATGGAIRFKATSDSYMAVWRNSIEFYTGYGDRTSTADSRFYADSFVQTSDVRLKENIGYLDHAKRIKPNDEVEIDNITSQDLYNFIKNTNLATYNYLFKKDPRLSFIAQDVLKDKKVGKYLAKVDEEDKGKRKYIDTNNLLSATVSVVKSLIEKVEQLEKEIEVLKEK